MQKRCLFYLNFVRLAAVCNLTSHLLYCQKLVGKYTFKFMSFWLLGESRILSNFYKFWGIFPCFDRDACQKFCLHRGKNEQLSTVCKSILQFTPSLKVLQAYIIIIVIIIIIIQPSQSTGLALARCILGKYLGVVCHCFPPRLDVPTFATRCLNDARDPSGGRCNCGRECCPVILPK